MKLVTKSQKLLNMLTEEELLNTAKMLRKTVRQKAGLALDWDKASADMRKWYIMLAKRVHNGEFITEGGK